MLSFYVSRGERRKENYSQLEKAVEMVQQSL